MDMKYPLEKVLSTGNNKVMLTERGSMFGYGNLVVDFRNLIDMQSFNVPVIMDLTHSTQKPGALDGKSGGNPEYAPYLACFQVLWEYVVFLQKLTLNQQKHYQTVLI